MNQKLISIGRILRTKLMLYKQYISRTTTYLSVINAGMILFLFLSKLKDAGLISWDLDKYTIWIFTIGMAGLLIVGWFEMKIMKGLQEEARINFAYQPPMVEMKEKIDEMYADFKTRKNA